MTYYLDQFIQKINAPVICIIDGIKTYYPSGKDLATHKFEKPYIISSITVDEKCAVIWLKENTSINNNNWIGEECVSFF